MTFRPAFFDESPLFWPIARGAAALQTCRDWPSPDDLTRLLGRLPVRFESAPATTRRGATLRADERYDARIACARSVPTRTGSWHDLSNALVWAAFPRAKLALHTRQHAAITARLGRDLRLPGSRTKEQDAIAMLDEGGVALLVRADRRAEVTSTMANGPAQAASKIVSEGWGCAVIFGHAIYESLALGDRRPVRAAAYRVEVDALEPAHGPRVARADAALADLLARPTPIGRGDFARVVVDDRLAEATAHADRRPTSLPTR